MSPQLAAERSHILSTKLFIPPLRPPYIRRPRLVARLDTDARVFLLSAPAGYGKSSLLSEWISERHPRAAWLTLDQSENHPTSFLLYFVAALRTLDANLGFLMERLLASPRSLPLHSVLISLINDLSGIEDPLFLILDDYHLMENQAVHRLVDFFIEHMPPSMHIILATRSDPNLPLPRWRSQKALTEIRAADLCFTYDELNQYFNQVLEFGLPGDELKLVLERTEGWAAGLQLTSLSMSGREDPHSYIKSFLAKDRYVVDYLMEEVLNRQTDRMTEFLLSTSFLRRLTAPLCDAVTGRSDSQELLDQLERANLFLFNLDHRRTWFRYHTLFADFLQQRLLRDRGMQHTGRLQQLAGDWCESNELADEAVEYALAAGDYLTASRRIEAIAEIDWDRGRQSKLLRWLNHLPEDKLRRNPRLCIFHARELFENGQENVALLRLAEAERALPNTDEGESLRGRIAVQRGVMASYRGEIRSIIQQSRRALKRLGEGDSMWRSVAATTLGFAYGWSGAGDMFKAETAFQEAVEISEKAGNHYFILFSSACLSTVLTFQGRLNEALTRYRGLARRVEQTRLTHTGVAGTIYSGLGAVLAQRNRFSEGAELVDKGIEHSEAGCDLIAQVGCIMNKIRIHFWLDDLDTVRRCLREADLKAKELPLPPWMTHILASFHGLALLSGGQPERALDWAEERGLSPHDDPGQQSEAEHLVLARILIARHSLDEAEAQLERLIENSHSRGRVYTQIEMLLQLAVCRYSAGQYQKARQALLRALTLAEPGRFFASFIVLGDSMEQMLREIAADEQAVQAISAEYVEDLLRAFKFKPELKSGGSEPLSERELEVLHFLAAGCSNREIAARLYISMNTVKTHIKNINSKLNVHNRTHAVFAARDLGLVE